MMVFIFSRVLAATPARLCSTLSTVAIETLALLAISFIPNNSSSTFFL
jgi:hypothetical protein